MVSASPDTFSDPEPSTQAELVEPARELDAAGAALIDVGGESRRTDRPAVDEGGEIAPVVPVIEPRAAEGLLVGRHLACASCARRARGRRRDGQRPERV
jgi:dihydropteroate synthase